MTEGVCLAMTKKECVTNPMNQYTSFRGKRAGAIIEKMRLLGAFVAIVALMAVALMPLDMALAQGTNVTRALPDALERGETFNVIVTFTAPADNFTAISLTDFAPWNVTVNAAWCQPTAAVKATGNMAEFSWWLTPYGNGTNFTARYKVNVSCGAELGNYTFGDGFLGYYIGNGTTHIYENITGDFNVTVVPPAICSTPSIDFYAALNGTNPENQTLQLWSSTPCMINWSLSDDADWLSENRTSGNCTNVTSSVAVSANTSGMPVGNYTANITIESPDANNSPRIVPVSLHIRTAGTLKGHVNLSRKQPAGDPTWETPLVVRFFDNSTKLEVGWSPVNITTDAYGNFTVEEVVVGPYDIGVKNWTSLSSMAYGKNFTAGNMTAIDFGLLIESDTDNDDQVKLVDFNRVLNSYGAMPGDASWNEMYDFNRSVKIDLVDFNLVLNNYGDKGDIYNYLP